MNIVEFYAKTPVERHLEIVVSGDRLYFDNEEYVILANDELKLIHSHKELEKNIASVKATLSQIDKKLEKRG